MTLRQRTAETILWIALLGVGIILGASVYQRISLIPDWGGALPQSLISYFKDPSVAKSIGRFWANALPPTALAVILALLTNWRVKARRRWLGLATLLFLAMLVWTEAYFVPKGVIPLMVHAGAGLSPEEITRRAQAWIFWDWFRMAGTVVTFLSLLKAATTPAPEA